MRRRKRVLDIGVPTGNPHLDIIIIFPAEPYLPTAHQSKRRQQKKRLERRIWNVYRKERKRASFD